MPEGWEVDESITPFDVSASGGSGIQGNAVQVVTAPTTSGGTLDDLARSAARQGGSRLAILAPVVVGGVEMVHVRGTAAGGLSDRYVAVVDLRRVSITFFYDGGVEEDKALQQALMDEVIATVRWSA